MAYTQIYRQKKVKADRIYFLIGDEEGWVIKDTRRLLKTVKDRAKIIIIPKTNHKINKNYLEVILNVLKSTK